MSFVIVGLGSTISAANAATAAPTTGLLAAGADEVSAAIAALFGAYGQAHQALSAQAAAFHQEFVQALTAAAGTYAAAEAAAASPLQSLLDPPLIGDGGPIYDAIQRANERLLIGFTNVVAGSNSH
jgi:hypothetical protein